MPCTRTRVQGRFILASPSAHPQHPHPHEEASIPRRRPPRRPHLRHCRRPVHRRARATRAGRWRQDDQAADRCRDHRDDRRGRFAGLPVDRPDHRQRLFDRTRRGRHPRDRLLRSHRCHRHVVRIRHQARHRRDVDDRERRPALRQLCRHRTGAPAPIDSICANLTISGGTGRYLNASGSANIEGVENIGSMPAVGVLVISGRLSY